MTKWPLSVTARDLATQWVVLENTGAVDRFDRTRELMEEMVRRVGVENTDILINQARATYRMLVP